MSRNLTEPDLIDKARIQELLVYFLSTYYKYFVYSFICEFFDHIFNRRVGFKSFDRTRSENDIASVREGAADGFVGLPPHDDNPSARETLEVLEILRQVPGKLSSVPDNPIVCHSGDENDVHKKIRQNNNVHWAYSDQIYGKERYPERLYSKYFFSKRN